MKPIDLIGIRNFRIFSDEKGFFEKFSEINILTGSNNSGKSSIIKFLQMLKNSIKGSEIPMILDLEQQEHLLGDFNNVLANPENREVEVSLPFNYFGLNSFYISLTYIIPENQNSYKAKLRKLKVVYEKDEKDIFSFNYRDATQEEINKHQKEFEERLEEYERKQEKKNKEKKARKNEPSTIVNYNFLSDIELKPTEDPLESYIEWYIDFTILKTLFESLLEFYNYHKDNKRNFDSEEDFDNYFKKTEITPSLFEKSFKHKINTENFKRFINQLEKKPQSGKEAIGYYDFQGDYPYYPPPEIESLFFYRSIEILKKKVNWEDADYENKKYSIIENSFANSCTLLVQRINSISYLSNIREENLRIYNSSLNTPFIRLLKEYESLDLKDSEFLNRYIKIFNIGEEIIVKYTLKYQLLRILIKVEENIERELVDFGYGIKQLILILIQIAVLSEKNKRIEEKYDNDGQYFKDDYLKSTLIIEEPESSLHPKWQSKLAEMFVDASNKFNIQFIIETHSEYLIRKFQTLVAQDKINGEKIKLFYLRDPKLRNKEKKQVDTFNINDDGSINYKIFDSGFFDENENLELSLLNIQRDRFLNDFDELKKNNEVNENKISELEHKIDDYINKLDIQIYQTVIKTRFDISKLSSISIKYLSSGQLLLNTIHHTSDFSPVIIQYGRTIENEIKEIFIAIGITENKKLMLGKFQGALEKFKTGTTVQSTYSNSILSLLPTELNNRFNNPTNLKVESLNDIRKIRNASGHSGQTKTKQDAIDYIEIVNDFLDKWISEKK